MHCGKIYIKIVAPILCMVMLFSSVIEVGGITMAEESIPNVMKNELQVTDRSVDFNADWTFNLGNVSGAELKNYDDSAWRKLSLPHDWSIEQDFTNSVSSEVGHLPGGVGWYRKLFILPIELQGKQISINFGGVYMDSNVYLNGELIGNYPNGYLPFSYDITSKLIYDGITPNVLAVKVTNVTIPGAQTSRWYSGSGIYRDVTLNVTDKVHVAQYGTVVTTPNIATEFNSGAVTVNVKTTTKNEGNQNANVKVRSTILNYNDNSVFTAPVETKAVSISAGSSYNFTGTISAKNPLLWSTDSPNLYKMRTEVLVNGEVVDTYEARFGFRWFKLDKDEGFSLNGQYMKLQGVCMHHDQGALGSVANEASIARQMKIMKEMGTNAIRVTHNPAADALLKQCDEQGLMVIEEAFDTWYNGKNANDYGRFFEKAATHPDAANGVTWGQFDLQQMIRRGINFPSIIMWSLGNEVFQSYEAKGVDTVKNLVKWTKEIDITRPTTMGEDKLRASANDTAGQNFIKIANEVDVVGMNYAESNIDGNYDSYRAMYPNWIMYGSETSSAIKSRGYYSDPTKTDGAEEVTEYQLSSYDNLAVGWGNTASNSLIPDRNRKWISGQFVWTGFDYIGEPTPYPFNQESKPKSSYFGIVDTAGFPKDDYYLYQSQWMNVDTNPMVHILPHWNFQDDNLREKVTVDGKIPVRIYSNAPTVELFMNGVSLGEKSFAQKTTSDGRIYQQQSTTSDRLYLEWLLEYEYVPGTTIVANAKDKDGFVISTDTVVTAADSTKLRTTADRLVINADGKDLSFITVDVTDASGYLVPTAMDQIYFDIKGNGKIVGVDNGDASSWERYKDTNGVWQRKAFNGKAVVIVQSTEDEGSFTLTASSAGLTTSDITVYTRTADTVSNTILGYDVFKVTTNTGVMPNLPKTVDAVLADGSRVAKQVEWEQPTAEEIASPSELTLKGVAETGDSVELVLTVRGLLGIMDVTIVTPIGVLPTLPNTVTSVWSDGFTEVRHVTWETLSMNNVAKIGIVNLSGVVEGTEMPAHAIIRVAEKIDEVNVAPASNGTVVTASYEEGPDKHPVKEINDAFFGSSNGWGNWNSTHRTSDQVTFQFDQAYDIGRITAWFTSMNTWQIPSEMTIDYWNGSAFVPVLHQSKTTNFSGRTSGSGDYSGDDVTFDEVQTDKLRFNFKVTYPNGKDMTKITELEVWGKGIAINSTARLSSLKLDDKDIENFDSENFMYTCKLPYNSDVPVVAAVAKDHASVFVRQALGTGSAAQVKVISEDGLVTQNYSIQFIELPAALDNVVLAPGSTKITEDDIVPLSVVGTLQDGKVLPNNQAIITYSVEDKDGHALTQGGNLLAYTAGKVNVTAHMTYLGKTVDSAPVEFTIAKNTYVKTVLSYEELNVTTRLGVPPTLPNTVLANFDKGLSRNLTVTWDTVDAGKLASYGSFTVQGTVNGYTLRPKVNVVVRDALVAQKISTATPRGVVPTLPSSLTVYFTDGSEKYNVTVKWNDVTDANFDIPEGSIVKVNGSVEVDGTELTASANVRIANTLQSPNYVVERNGYTLPIGIASYTNDQYIKNTGYDKANYISDGNKSFEMSASKQIWSNWVDATTQRSVDWISAVIANEGTRTEKDVDKISVGFCRETQVGGLIEIPENYFVEFYTGPIDYTIQDSNGQVASWNNNPLNDNNNWHEVEYISKPGTSSINGTSMTDVTFKPVKTNLVRVRMKAYSGRCLGVTELEVYGKSPVINDGFELTEIRIGDKNVLDQFNSDLTMTYRLEKNILPTITVNATNNAAVTVISAVNVNGTTKIIVVPENGNEINARVYKIQHNMLSYILGDLTGEGQVTVTDIVKLRRLILGDITYTETEFKAGDMNEDNELTVTDIVAIRKKILGG